MRDDNGRIEDILEAIARIERIAVKGKDQFLNDEMVQVWVIHHLEIIGEASRGISPEYKKQNDTIPWSAIIGMRNILVHHYFGIDREAVWRVVEHDLPLLKGQFQTIVHSVQRDP